MPMRDSFTRMVLSAAANGVRDPVLCAAIAEQVLINLSRAVETGTHDPTPSDGPQHPAR